MWVTTGAALLPGTLCSSHSRPHPLCVPHPPTPLFPHDWIYVNVGPSSSLVSRPNGLMVSRQGAQRAQAPAATAPPLQTPGLGLWAAARRPIACCEGPIHLCPPQRLAASLLEMGPPPLPTVLPSSPSPLPSPLSLMGTWCGRGMAPVSVISLGKLLRSLLG